MGTTTPGQSGSESNVNNLECSATKLKKKLYLC